MAGCTTYSTWPGTLEFTTQGMYSFQKLKRMVQVRGFEVGALHYTGLALPCRTAVALQ